MRRLEENLEPYMTLKYILLEEAKTTYAITDKLFRRVTDGSFVETGHGKELDDYGTTPDALCKLWLW